MGEVSGAVDAIKSQLAILHGACDAVSHRELVGLLAEVTTVARSIPALEHRVLNRLVAETEPHRLGESSWTRVLTTALRVSGRDARPTGSGDGVGAAARDDRGAGGAAVAGHRRRPSPRCARG